MRLLPRFEDEQKFSVSCQTNSVPVHKTISFDLFADFILRAVTGADFIVSFFVESKALNRAQSKLRNCFRNAAIGKNQPIENRNCGRVKYNTLFSTNILSQLKLFG